VTEPQRSGAIRSFQPMSFCLTPFRPLKRDMAFFVKWLSENVLRLMTSVVYPYVHSNLIPTASRNEISAWKIWEIFAMDKDVDSS